MGILFQSSHMDRTPPYNISVVLLQVSSPSCVEILHVHRIYIQSLLPDCRMFPFSFSNKLPSDSLSIALPTENARWMPCPFSAFTTLISLDYGFQTAIVSLTIVEIVPFLSTADSQHRPVNRSLCDAHAVASMGCSGIVFSWL